MFTYIDSHYILAGDTLLLLSTDRETAVIPSRIAGSPVRRIGRRALCSGTDSLLRVYIEEGIEEIGGQAFERGLKAIRLPSTLKTAQDSLTMYPGLEDITLCCRFSGPMPEKRLFAASLRTAGQTDAGGLFILRDVSTFPEINFAGRLPGLQLFPADRAGSVFFSEKYFVLADQNHYEAPRCFCQDQIRDDAGEASEAEVIRKLAGSGTVCSLSAEEETQADWFLRSGAQLSRLVAPSAVLAFSPGDIRGLGRDILVSFKVLRGYFFFPQLQKIVTDRGREFFLYSRMYPSGQNVFRVNMAVLDREGNFAPAKEAGEAYAKYKLLALI